MIRWHRFAFWIVALAILGSGADALAQAVTKTGIPTPIIVMVDPQVVVQQSKAGQSIRQQHDT